MTMTRASLSLVTATLAALAVALAARPCLGAGFLI